MTTSTKLARTDNGADFITNGSYYQVFPQGQWITKISLPQGIEYVKREKFLYSIGLTFLALNTEATENMTYDYLNSINMLKAVISTPISSAGLTQIVKMIYNLRDKKGELKLTPNKRRIIIFSDTCTMTQKEKMIIINKEMGTMKTEATKQRIYESIEGWDKQTKITSELIALEVGMSLRTVKTYWSEFKEYVKIKNNDIKAEIVASIKNKTNNTKETKTEEMRREDVNPSRIIEDDIMGAMVNFGPNKSVVFLDDEDDDEEDYDGEIDFSIKGSKTRMDMILEETEKEIANKKSNQIVLDPLTEKQYMEIWSKGWPTYQGYLNGEQIK